MSGKFTIADLASFETLVAPKVLKIVYWLGLAGIAIGCLITFFGSFAVMQYDFASGLGTMLMSAIFLVLGVLMWRVVVEMYLVIFGIYERLGDIKDSVKKDV
jgi:uncharacterized membrane protein